MTSGNFFTFDVKKTGTENMQSDYFKVNYSLMWKWFHLQTGIAMGNGNYSNPRFMLQFGYMYIF